MRAPRGRGLSRAPTRVDEPSRPAHTLRQRYLALLGREWCRSEHRRACHDGPRARRTPSARMEHRAREAHRASSLRPRRPPRAPPTHRTPRQRAASTMSVGATSARSPLPLIDNAARPGNLDQRAVGLLSYRGPSGVDRGGRPAAHRQVVVTADAFGRPRIWRPGWAEQGRFGTSVHGLRGLRTRTGPRPTCSERRPRAGPGEVTARVRDPERDTQFERSRSAYQYVAEFSISTPERYEVSVTGGAGEVLVVPDTVASRRGPWPVLALAGLVAIVASVALGALGLRRR